MTFNDIFNCCHSEMYYVCASLVSGISVLKHQKNSEEEIRIINDCIKSCFHRLDEMNVTFRFQNSLIYIAEKIDSRADYLINMIEKAVFHAGGIENVYRRIS